MMHMNSHRLVYVAALVLMGASVSFGDDTIIKSIIDRRTDLAAYCTDGVSVNRFHFQDSSGPFYASRDLTIAGMYDEWRGVEIELDADRVIKLNGHMWGYSGNFTCKGGIYDFQNTYHFNANSWLDNCNLTGMILDGAVFTNMPSVVLQNGNKKGGTWQMKNGARIYGGSLFKLTGAPTWDFLLNLESGSQISCVYFETDDWAGNYAHTLQLSGEGTRLYASGGQNKENKIGCKSLKNSVIVSDHADLTLSGTTFVGRDATSMNNMLRVSDAATATLGAVYLGCNGGGSNRVEVLNEATLTTGAFYLNGGNVATKGNVVVVSNATIVARRFFSVHNMGSDATVLLSGDHPQVQINAGTRQSESTAAEFKNGMTLSFDLPVEGYRDGITPIVITGTEVKNGVEQSIGTYSDTTFRIRFDGIEEMQRRMMKTGTARRQIPLLTCRGGIDYPAEVMDDANAQLPLGARLYRNSSGGQNRLMLEVKADVGTMVIVR